MKSIAHSALACVLGGDDNRCWGMAAEKVGTFTIGTRWQYVMLFVLDCIIARPEYVTALHYFMIPLLALLAYGVRFMGTGQGWLAYEAGMDRMKAITRGWPYLIFAVVLTAIDNDPHRMYVGFSFPVCAAFYRYAPRTPVKDATALAEILVGIYAILIVVA